MWANGLRQRHDVLGVREREGHIFFKIRGNRPRYHTVIACSHEFEQRAALRLQHVVRDTKEQEKLEIGTGYPSILYLNFHP
jgi:hypothetical protein